MIKNNLWNEYPPEPASEEELDLENKQKQAMQLEKAREKVCSAIYPHTAKTELPHERI